MREAPEKHVERSASLKSSHLSSSKTPKVDSKSKVTEVKTKTAKKSTQTVAKTKANVKPEKPTQTASGKTKGKGYYSPGTKKSDVVALADTKKGKSTSKTASSEKSVAKATSKTKKTSKTKS